MMLRRYTSTLGLSAALAFAIATGPDVGKEMPNFRAADQNGVQHTLHDLLGPNGAVLVVFRSADW